MWSIFAPTSKLFSSVEIFEYSQTKNLYYQLPLVCQFGIGKIKIKYREWDSKCHLQNTSEIKKAFKTYVKKEISGIGSWNFYEMAHKVIDRYPLVSLELFDLRLFIKGVLMLICYWSDHVQQFSCTAVHGTKQFL